MALYDELGGAGAVSAAVDSFYDRVTADPDLVQYFEGVDMARLKAHQRSFIAVALGGPESYRGRDMTRRMRLLALRRKLSMLWSLILLTLLPAWVFLRPRLM